jgi:hypothetical protein
MAKAAADLRPAIEISSHAIRAALLFDDAREPHVRRERHGRQLLFEKPVPTQTGP